MLKETLAELYERDLSKLKEEIELYSEEAALWLIEENIANPAGNLCLHLCGNLQHFIGAVLGDSDYMRDRDAEFSRKNVLRNELISEIETTTAAVKNTLTKLNEDDLAKPYPLEVFGHPMTTEFFLVHLATHLNYHLGQINYHRRFLARK